MKDLIKQDLEKVTQPQFKKLALGEFLQHLVLQSLYRNNAFKNITFTGGTALRLLYHTNRYSEDLDFSLTNKENIDFNKLFKNVQNDLKLQNIEFELYLDNEKTVLKADLRFKHLLKEFNLSPLKDQKLTVKLEIDKNPPKGGNPEIALVTSPVSYTVSVFDLSSLFGTKLHAVFFRQYTKGRDYYDLVWFLGKGIKPNFKLLNNAIIQTHGEKYIIKENEFKEKLISHLEKVDFKKIRQEVERFAINQEEVKFLDLEPIKSLLRRY